MGGKLHKFQNYFSIYFLKVMAYQ